MRALNILLADAYPLVRSGLKSIVKSLGDQHITWEASRGQEALMLASQHSLDLLLVNLALTCVSGSEVATNIMERHQDAKVIMLTSHVDHPQLINLCNKGLKGVVLLDSPVEEVVGAIRTVLLGDRYFAADFEILFQKSKQTDSPRPLKFTSQEITLVELLAKGKTSKEIALILGKTSKTIETYRHRLLKKAKVSNTTELLTYFHRYGLWNGSARDI